MLNLLIAKFYLRQVEKNDEHPVLNTICYFALVLFFAYYTIAIPLTTLIERLGLKDRENKTPEIIGWTSAAILIPAFLYYYLIRKRNIERIVNKYGDRKISNVTIGILLFLIPIVLFFLGPTITVLLFGGSMFNHDYKGLLTPYLN
jgi:hypothetical protein